jgi:tetratricopeptide (TPR) repeat protein
MHGTAAHGRQFIEIAAERRKLSELIERINAPDDDDAELGDVRAEAAYVLGNFFASGNRDDQARAAYELALTYDPKHAWACNNLGYALIERGEELDRAGELLERAHAERPGEPSITDSLGWLRYKQGIIEDERGADGVIVRRGAVALLQEAAMSDYGRQSPTILDHLGDAMWLAGRREEAERYWKMAEDTAAALLNRTAGDPPGTAPASVIEENRNIRESTRTKRERARSGGPVPVAPWFNNANPLPAPGADGSDPEGSGSGQDPSH